jgi:fibronectin-binding autotransporter adhesin
MSASTRCWFVKRYVTACFAAVAALIVGSPQARAAMIWQPASPAPWNGSLNWFPPGPPSLLDDAYIDNGGTAQIFSGVANCNNLYLGSLSGNSGNVSMTAGTFITTNSVFVGDGGIGSLSQAGGTAAIGSSMHIGNSASGSGVCAISGASALNVHLDLDVGKAGSGTMTQSDNSLLDVGNSMYVGRSSTGVGTYLLQDAGALTVQLDLDVGSSGNGTLVQRGNSAATIVRTVDIGHFSGSSGTYIIQDNGVLDATQSLIVGHFGDGTMNQSGSSKVNVLNGWMILAGQPASSGTVNLSGGTLNLSNAALGVGRMGTGVFNQSGGSVTVPYFVVGVFTGGDGTYNLTGGLLDSMGMTPGVQFVGWGGIQGVFNHGLDSSGTGVNTVNDLRIGSGSCPGMYNLRNGLTGQIDLQANTILVGTNGTFNQFDGYVDCSQNMQVNGAYTQYVGLITVHGVATINGKYEENGGIFNVLGGSGSGVGMSVNGTYTMKGGTLYVQQQMTVDGIFNQSGSSAVNVRKLKVGTSYYQTTYKYYNSVADPNWFSKYTLTTAGQVMVTGPTCAYIGYDRKGIFEQNGLGTECNVDHKLYVGYNSGSDGTYQLIQGSMSVGEEIRVGADSGIGRFYWKNSSSDPSTSSTIDTPLITLGSKGAWAMGYNFNVSDLAGGSTVLFEQATTVAGLDLATLEVTSGATATHAVDATHTLGGLKLGGDDGYGLYDQSAGSVLNARYVEINAGSAYSFSGGGFGTLNVTSGGLHVAGMLNANSQSVTINVASNSLVNFAAATFEGTESTSLNIAANTLSIFPDGFDPAAVFGGGYTNAGDVHTAGTPLVIGAGKHYQFTGIIDDPLYVEANASLVPTPDKFVDICDFRSISDNSIVNLGFGSCTVRSSATVRGDGILSARNAYVTAPVATPASLAQNDHGSVTISDSLYLGYRDNESGTYAMAGNAALQVGCLVIGNGNVGGNSGDRSVFATSGQSTVTVSDGLFIGNQSGAYGEYVSQSDASSLDAPLMVVGSAGAGIFTHQHGSVVVHGSLVLGAQAGSSGTYVVEAGILAGDKLETDSLIVGGEGGGTLRILSANLPITVHDELRFGANATMLAADVAPDTTIHFTGTTIENRSADATRLTGLSNLSLVLERGNSDIVALDVLGANKGNDPSGWTNNFALDTVTIGGAGGAAYVQLGAVGLPADGSQALYVNNLEVAAGSQLDLKGKALYYRESATQRGVVNLDDGYWGGTPILINIGDMIGSGTLDAPVRNAGGTMNLGNATVTGALDIDGGTLAVQADSRLTVAGGLNIHNGTLTLPSTGTIAANVLYAAPADCIASGVFAGEGNLTKAGSSTLTLAGDNLYTGNTTITAGTLELVDGGNIASSSGVENYSRFVINGGEHIVSSITGFGETYVAVGTLAATSIVQDTLTIGAAPDAATLANTKDCYAVPEPSVVVLLLSAIAIGIALRVRRN